MNIMKSHKERNEQYYKDFKDGIREAKECLQEIMDAAGIEGVAQDFPLGTLLELHRLSMLMGEHPKYSKKYTMRYFNTIKNEEEERHKKEAEEAKT